MRKLENTYVENEERNLPWKNKIKLNTRVVIVSFSGYYCKLF